MVVHSNMWGQFQNHACRWTLTLVGQLAADGHTAAITKFFDSAAQKDRQVPDHAQPYIYIYIYIYIHTYNIYASTLNLMHCLTGNQCRSTRTGVICAELGVRTTRRAALLCIIYRCVK